MASSLSSTPASSAVGQVGALPASAPDAHAPFTNTPPLAQPDPLPPALQAWWNLDAVQRMFRDAVGRFLTLNKQIKEQREQLHNFHTACSTSAGFQRLPKALAHDVVRRIKLPATKDVNFFNEERAAIQKIEAKAAKGIYDQLIGARNRLLTELTRQVDVTTFVAEEVRLQRIEIDRYATWIQVQFPRQIRIAVDHEDASAGGGDAMDIEAPQDLSRTIATSSHPTMPPTTSTSNCTPVY